MTWAGVRSGIALRLALVPGLTVYERTPSNINVDDLAIIELGEEGIVPAAHGNLAELTARVIVIANRATVNESEEALDAYLWPAGTSSIIAAINADKTLGGAVDDCYWVSTGTPYGTPQDGETGRQSEVHLRCVVNADEPDNFIQETCMLHVDAQLTDAQLRDLAANPVEILAAPGDDLFYDVLGAVVAADTRQGAYTLSNNADGPYLAVGTPQALLSASWTDADFFPNGSNSGFATITGHFPSNYASENKPMTIGTITDLTGGDPANTLSIRVYYRIEPAVPFGT